MTHSELKEQALKKYNNISMGNGGEQRTLKLFNILDLLNKENLTDADVAQLKHFILVDRKQLETTAYVANTIVSPTSWGSETIVLKRKAGKIVEID